MEPGAPPVRRNRHKSISVAATVAGCAVFAGVASASGGGGIGGGGVGSPDPPKLSGVICLERCADVRVATVDSRVQLSGRNLDGVDKVRFKAASGGRVATTPTAVGPTAVEVKVPDGAATGTVRASAYGVEAETPKRKPLKIVGAGQIPEAGPFKLTAAQATPRRTFYDARRAPRVSFVFQGKGATDVRVEVVDRKSKDVVDTFIDKAAEPGTRNKAKWDGRTAAGKPAPGGDYKFRIGSAVDGRTVATKDSKFDYHLYRFPIDARHTYGDGFGAGRGHQGQDVFAKCGTPLHAVRGGRVQTVDVQSSAGNYIVIDGKGTKVDTFYAHLRRRSPLREGSRVRTGQVIGNVGQTGNASGCHLHFEVWSAPGWYEGGSAMSSVTRQLRNWDSWS